ncbi:hypothetical protein PFISCL1PPCAC_19797, partial [Pristionchus fissidentatus]
LVEGMSYYRDDSLSTAAGNFQMSTPNSFNQGFGKPPGFNQPGFHWNLPKKDETPRRSFPSKSGTTAPGQKRQVTDGKTPAQLLNELFKGISDTYDNEGSGFKCNLVVEGQTFHAVAASKKHAKHEACLVALRCLRPDVAADYHPPPAANPPQPIQQKKRKVEPLDGACSLKDLLSQLCIKENKKFKIDATDVSEAGVDEKQRKYSCVLTFTEEGKMYTQTADALNVATALAMREALKEVFNVTEGDIMKVVKRGQIKKLHNMQSFSALTMMCMSSHYKLVSVNFEDVMEGKIPHFISYFIIKNCDGEEIQVKSPKCKSKALAKERGAAVALSDIFQIHPASLMGAEKEEVTNAVKELYEIGTRQKPSLRPEFTDLGEEMNGSTKYFKFKCVVSGREFIGSGVSKRDAKNESANLALNNIFHKNVKKEAGEEGAKEDCFTQATCSYVKTQYEQMCNFYGMHPSSDFSCFVLLNDNNEKKLISIGSSPQNTTPFSVLAEGRGKPLVHHDSVVYARRGAQRFFITQLAKAEAGEESCLESDGGGMYRLKKSLRLAIVTSNPIDIRFSAPESILRRLAVYGQCNLLEAVDDKESPRIHCAADKIFKWAHLGVQGSLLTNRINPIIPSSILTISPCPLSDLSYLHSFTSRICPPPFPISVHASSTQVDASPSPAHLWSRAESKLEKISHMTGLTSEGEQSCCSKYELYKAFLDATPRFPKGVPYDEAKKMAGGYLSSKGLFYHEMDKAGLGKWNGLRGLADRFVIG